MYIVILYDGDAGQPAEELVYDIFGGWTPRDGADPKVFEEEFEAKQFADEVDCGPMEEVKVEQYDPKEHTNV